MFRAWTAASLAACIGLAGCGSAGKGGAIGATGRGTISVTSPAFADGAAIPVKYSCNGDNVSPPLAWSNVPAGASELAVIVDDPDAPSGVFYHWIVAHIPATTTAISEGGKPAGVVEATGSSGQPGYTGMCPPDRQTHHYRFTVYALKAASGVTSGMAPIEAKNRIVAVERAQGVLVGKFGR